MIMTGQPTLTHTPRRPHWWKQNDDLLCVVFFLYFRVVLSQWILSSGWTDHDHDGKNVGIWIDESKGLSTFRDSHGSKRIHIWAHGSVVLSIHIAPRIHISSHISIYLVVVSIFVFLSLGEITQSDEHMFAKGLKPPTCDSQISNRNSIRVLHKNSKVIFYTRESDLDKVTND